MMYNDEIRYVGLSGRLICHNNCRVKRIVKVRDDWDSYGVVFDTEYGGDEFVSIGEPGTGVILDSKVEAIVDNSGILDLSKVKLRLYNREITEVFDNL